MIDAITYTTSDLLANLAADQREETLGGRNKELFRRARVALEYGCDPDEVRSILTEAGIACGLTEQEVHATLRSALKADPVARVPDGTPPVPADHWADVWSRTWPRVIGVRLAPDGQGGFDRKPNAKRWQYSWDERNDRTQAGDLYAIIIPPGLGVLDVDDPAVFDALGLAYPPDAPWYYSYSGAPERPKRHVWFRLHPDRPYPKRSIKEWAGADRLVGGTGIAYIREKTMADDLPNPADMPLAPDWFQCAATPESSDAPELGSDLLPTPDGWPAEPEDEAFYGLAGELARTIAPFTEASDTGILTSILTIASALFRGHIFESGDRQTTNLYAVLVGQSGLGRKSHAQSLAMRVFDLAVGDAWRSILLPGLESGQALPRIMSDRYAAGTGDPRALLLEGELGRMLAGMGRESSTLSTTLRVAWDGLPLGRSVVSRAESAIATVHHIAMLGAITDRELRSKLTDEEQANGFGNRVIWIAVRSPRVIVDPVPVVDMIDQPILERLRENLAGAQLGRTHLWTPEAKDLWATWYRYWRLQQSAALSSTLVARGPAQVVRLAMTYALLDGAGNRMGDLGRIALTGGHLRAALALWAYSERSVKYIFGDSTGDLIADSLLRAIGDVGDVITYSDARSEVAGNRTPPLDAAVETLTRLGKVRVDHTQHPRGGRKLRTITRVHLSKRRKSGVCAKRAKRAKSATRTPSSTNRSLVSRGSVCAVCSASGDPSGCLQTGWATLTRAARAST